MFSYCILLGLFFIMLSSCLSVRHNVSQTHSIIREAKYYEHNFEEANFFIYYREIIDLIVVENLLGP